MKTTEKIIQLLKLKGPMTAKALAEQLKVTTMGVRQHLQQLQETGELSIEDRKASRGRPTRYWSLTEATQQYFPDAHEELTVQLIDSIQVIFGDEGLDKLIAHRELKSMEVYQSALSKLKGLQNKLDALALIRSEEGYMASVIKEENFYWLIENHCSICAAAKRCRNFCRSELQQFQSLLKKEAVVTREEHIVEGARRCAYKVIPKHKTVI